MRIHCFQHVEFESPGTIVEWADKMGYVITYTNFFEPSFIIPSLSDFDVLVIMGGSMNVDEEQVYPWLQKEKLFIRQAIDGGKKILGICLGAQLIAAALGSRVYKGREKEIGFFPVHFTEEARSTILFSHFKNPYTLFHWHGDTFDLPEHTQLIAYSEACRHQAFLLENRVLGLQFHLEMNEESIDKMIDHGGYELKEEGKFIQSSVEIRSEKTVLWENRNDNFVLLSKFINSSPGPFSMG